MSGEGTAWYLRHSECHQHAEPEEDAEDHAEAHLAAGTEDVWICSPDCPGTQR